MNDELLFVETLFLFGVFVEKQCVEFSLISFGTLKYNCIIKTREMFKLLAN